MMVKALRRFSSALADGDVIAVADVAADHSRHAGRSGERRQPPAPCMTNLASSASHRSPTDGWAHSPVPPSTVTTSSTWWPGSGPAINELIVRSRDALGATAIVVTHDMASLPVIADRVAFLYDGSIRFDGSPADFAESPDPLIGAFLLGNAGTVDPLRPPVWNRG
jgi:hypothetical protein